MTGPVVTVSPRRNVGDYEHMARRSLEGHGVAVFGAVTADGRQQAHLRRLADRLGADPGLRVSFVQRTDGVTQLAVMPAGQRYVGWFGDVKGAPEDDPGDVTVEFLDGDPRDWPDTV